MSDERTKVETIGGGRPSENQLKNAEEHLARTGSLPPPSILALLVEIRELWEEAKAREDGRARVRDLPFGAGRSAAGIDEDLAEIEADMAAGENVDFCDIRQLIDEVRASRNASR
jgi:hypothetical protein